MSVKFVNFTVVPYAGALAGQAVGICTPSSYNPRVVPVVIDWSKYPGGGVSVNLSAGVLQPLDFIRSVVIDNLGQQASIEINFPDTNFTMACNSGALLSGYALTFQLSALIFNTASVPTGFTTIYFCNFLVDTYNQSTVPITAVLEAITSTGPGNANFSTPALGSQLSIITQALTPTGINQILFGGARLSGTIVVTNMSVKVLGCYSPGNSPLAMVIEIDDNLATNWARWQFYAPNDMSIFPLLSIGDQSDIQLRLPATRQFSLVNVLNATPGFMQLTIFWDWLA